MAKRKNGRKQANLIAQGGMVSVAFLLASACGLLRHIPLTAMWGDRGNGIYSAAFDLFSLACLLSAYGLPFVMASLLKARLKQGQYQNAARITAAALLYATVTGLAAGAFLFFGSAFLTKEVMSDPLAALPLQTLSIAVVVTAWNSALRGFFFGNGAMFPVVVSMLAEQIVTLAVGLPLADVRRQYGMKVGVLLQNENFALSFAVSGFAGGILAGAALSFLFLLLLYPVSRAYYKKKNKKSARRGREGTGQAVYTFFVNLLPVLLFALFLRGYMPVQQILFRLLTADRLGTDQAACQWGVYAGKYKLVTILPVVFTMAMGATLREKVYLLQRREHYPQMRDRIQSVLQASMILVIPLSVMTGTLAVPFLDTFFPGQDTGMASAMFLTGFPTAVFYSAAWVLAEVLWGMRKKSLVLLCGITAFAVHIGALYSMLALLDLGISGVVYADIVYAFCLLVLSGAAVQRQCRFRNGLLRSNAAPIIAAAVMGVLLFILTKALADIVAPGVLLVSGMIVGTIVYFTLLLIFRGVTERQLRLVPGGGLVCMMGKAFRLL